MAKLDRPLKFFLIATGVFTLLIGSVVIFSLQQIPDQVYVSDNDPLMVQAEDLARGSFDRFLELRKKHPESSFVKFNTRDGDTWGNVLLVDGQYIKVERNDIPMDPYKQIQVQFDLSLPEVEDWLVELEDGKVYGGFTSQVVLHYEKKQQGDSDRIDSLLALFQDKHIGL